jgi:hypothetical protein
MEIDKTVNRLFNDATVRQQRMELMKNEGDRQHQESTQEKPIINPKSKEITKKAGEPPIYERFGKLLARKEQKLQRIREEMEAAARKKDPEAFNPTFKP